MGFGVNILLTRRVFWVAAMWNFRAFRCCAASDVDYMLMARELLRGTMLAVNIHPGIESGIWRNLFAATGLAGIVLCGTGTSSKLSTWTFRLPGPIS
jgi:hypothetical protein